MTYKALFLLILSLIIFKPLKAQIDNTKALKSIDSLLSISQFHEAKVVIDNIYSTLNKNINHKKDLKIKASLLIKLSIIYEHEENYAQSIQTALTLIESFSAEDCPQEIFRAYLQIALIYEINKEWKNCLLYLEKARNLAQNYNIESIYSQYCIRYASYLRFNNEIDSALIYTQMALDLSLKYNNKRDLVDAYLLFSILYAGKQPLLAIVYKKKAIAEYIDKKEYNTAIDMYNSIAYDYFDLNDIGEAFLYNDSSFILNEIYNIPNSSSQYLTRSNLYQRIENIDSAFYYYTLYHDAFYKDKDSLQSLKIAQITEKYQFEKQEEIIKIQKQRVLFLIIIAICIAFILIIIIQKNRKINANNDIIAKQLNEVSKLLEQKKLLNSELQHRVKNNLQHIISILELQKESLNFNNIDEVIRENQNRIHSMALLQKKINTLENINEINLEKYINELTHIVHESYYNENKKIAINLSCNLHKISIEKALPIGLILVELLSNSIKHAFPNQDHGIIDIHIIKKTNLQNNQLIYKDNGKGFNFNITYNKGLGLEIIKGLIEQLNANINTPQTNGFELVIYFQ